MRKTMYAVLGMITWRIAKRQLRRRAGFEEVKYGCDQVLKVHDLQSARLSDVRHNWQRGEPSEQSASAVGRVPDHHRWPQNHPVEISHHERLIPSRLAPRDRRPVDVARTVRSMLQMLLLDQDPHQRAQRRITRRIVHLLEHLLRRGFAEPVHDFHDLPLAAAEAMVHGRVLVG